MLTDRPIKGVCFSGDGKRLLATEGVWNLTAQFDLRGSLGSLEDAPSGRWGPTPPPPGRP